MDKPLSLGPVTGTSSLLRTSEGLLTTTLTGIAGTVVAGDYDPSVQMAAVLGLAVAVSAYCVSRGLSKKDAK